MERLAAAWRARRADGLLLVARSSQAVLPPGCGAFFGDGQTFGVADLDAAEPLQRLASARIPPGASRWIPEALPGVDVLHLTVSPSPRVLLLGAGPDAQPVAELASFLGWSTTVIDHRPHYAQAERFPGAEYVLDGGPPALLRTLRSISRESERYAAAIVMSHHFASDRQYLAGLAGSDIPYIGLLGPAVRRERLLGQLGVQAALLGNRLRAPVGLDLGATTPEEIALAIVAEIQATLSGRDGIASLSRLRPPAQATAPAARLTSDTVSR
jgi:xanthine/CO dehydrogenase XdhC/CoxF family maturation factor